MPQLAETSPEFPSRSTAELFDRIDSAALSQIDCAGAKRLAEKLIRLFDSIAASRRPCRGTEDSIMREGHFSREEVHAFSQRLQNPDDRKHAIADLCSHLMRRNLPRV